MDENHYCSAPLPSQLCPSGSRSSTFVLEVSDRRGLTRDGTRRSIKDHEKFTERYSMDITQFEQLINLLAERLPTATASSEILEGTTLRPDFAREQRVSWAQFPNLDLSCASELDTWFISFEARMTASRVPEENWAARFLECPVVEESTKVHIRGLKPFTYERLRATILHDHGPVDPVNYFKREMFRVRGEKREDVRETLMRILTKHNRAAQAAGVQEMQARDLCYAFIDAFPVEIRKELEQKLALVFAQQEPFEHIFRLAPSKQESETSLYSIKEDIEERIRDAVALAIQDTRQNFHRPQWKRRRGASPPKFARVVRCPPPEGTPGCPGCGSAACPDRQHCPARSAVCFGCNRTGHFQRMCKTFPFQAGPRSQ